MCPWQDHGTGAPTLTQQPLRVTVAAPACPNRCGAPASAGSEERQCHSGWATRQARATDLLAGPVLSGLAATPRPARQRRRHRLILPCYQVPTRSCPADSRLHLPASWLHHVIGNQPPSSNTGSANPCRLPAGAGRWSARSTCAISAHALLQSTASARYSASPEGFPGKHHRMSLVACRCRSRRSPKQQLHDR